MQVLPEYDLSVTPNPNVGSIRIRDVFNKGANRLGRGLVRLMLVIVVVLVVANAIFITSMLDPNFKLQLNNFMAQAVSFIQTTTSGVNTFIGTIH